VAARPPCQVSYHNVSKHSHQHQNYGDPQTPIAMGMLPVRAVESDALATCTARLVMAVFCPAHGTF
jgi:hypothetical protein